MRLRRVGENLLLVLGGVLVALAGLEAGLRVVDPPAEVYNPLHGFHQADVQLGWIGKPGIRRRFRRLDFDAIVVHGPDGFRRVEPEPPPAASRRALFLGDSFTWGWGVGQGEVFTDVLQQRLGSSVALFNRGVNAYGTAQEYLLLQRELDQRHYDLVALLFFQNDVTENLHHGRYRPYFELIDDRLEVRNLPTPAELESPMKAFFKEHSRAFLFLNTQGAYLKARWKRDAAEDAADDAATDAREPAAALLQQGYALTRRLLLEMASVVHRYGGRFAVVFIPFPDQLVGRPRPAWSDEVHEVITALCRQHDLALVDLTDDFRRHEGGASLYFPRDGHWNAAGHRLAADALLRSGLLGPAPSS